MESSSRSNFLSVMFVQFYVDDYPNWSGHRFALYVSFRFEEYTPGPKMNAVIHDRNCF